MGAENKNTLKIIVGTVVVVGVLWVINHWMSKEESPAVVNPMPAAQPVGVVIDEPKAIIVPSVQELGVTPTPSANTQQTQPEKKQKAQPVYDPPSSDIILIQ